MTEITRRATLTGAAAAAVVPLAATLPASAAAPVSGKQAPAYYRYKVGDFEVTAILDGVRPVKIDANTARNAKLEEVQAVLAASRLPTDQVGYYFHPTVVNTVFQACPARYRQWTGQLAGRHWTTRRHAHRRRRRPEGDRHRGDLALPR